MERILDLDADGVRRLQTQWFGSPEDRSCLHTAIVGNGLGRRIDRIEDAGPGDFVQLWRTNGTGHSAVFLEAVREEGRVVGLRYWSSQGSTNGVARNVERFADAGGTPARPDARTTPSDGAIAGRAPPRGGVGHCTNSARGGPAREVISRGVVPSATRRDSGGCAPQCSTAQCSAAQHSTAQRQRNAAQHSATAAQCSTAQHSTSHRSAMQRSTALRNAMQRSTAHRSAMQRSTAQRSADTMQPRPRDRTRSNRSIRTGPGPDRAAATRPAGISPPASTAGALRRRSVRTARSTRARRPHAVARSTG